MPRLLITEEYGYRYWAADLTEGEYQQLVARWKTMVGLHGCVPVRLIIPQATILSSEQLRERQWDVHCHVHEADDSVLGNVDYEIPPLGDDDVFWMEGVPYSFGEISKMMKEERDAIP